VFWMRATRMTMLKLADPPCKERLPVALGRADVSLAAPACHCYGRELRWNTNSRHSAEPTRRKSRGQVSPCSHSCSLVPGTCATFENRS
jgi:hypothetical protein